MKYIFRYCFIDQQGKQGEDYTTKDVINTVFNFEALKELQNEIRDSHNYKKVIITDFKQIGGVKK